MVRVARLSRALPRFRGKTRLQRLVTKGLASAPGATSVLVEVGGVRWSLDVAEGIQFRILWDGQHDPHVVGWLTGKLQGRLQPVLWDVGANIGAIAFSVAAATPGLRVESFEPSAATRAKLLANAALNPGLDMHVHGVALSDQTGTARFFESAEVDNGGLGALYAASNTVAEGTEVAVARGDSIIAQGLAAVPHVVKIDVEGFELEVLAGLSETLARHRPLLCVESSGYRLAERGLAPDSIVRRLEALGYRVMAIDPRGSHGEELSLATVDLGDNLDLAAYPLT